MIATVLCVWFVLSILALLFFNNWANNAGSAALALLLPIYLSSLSLFASVISLLTFVAMRLFGA